jgi:hypothetical protein
MVYFPTHIDHALKLLSWLRCLGLTKDNVAEAYYLRIEPKDKERRNCTARTQKNAISNSKPCADLLCLGSTSDFGWSVVQKLDSVVCRVLETSYGNMIWFGIALVWSLWWHLVAWKYIIGLEPCGSDFGWFWQALVVKPDLQGCELLWPYPYGWLVVCVCQDLRPRSWLTLEPKPHQFLRKPKFEPRSLRF